ncbi:hypothetical protein N0V82_010336 [Gnomoniopsis sp. IMI 355080]|nr:hypothetical protein N0V82_010336 [Gnomoniopsis sp. IMI 355080]
MGSVTDHQIAVDVPVLIVGGGPTGLLAAYLLSKFGVKSLIVEKYPQRLAAPKAHALCPRTLEICRQFGLDTAALRRLGTCRDDAYWVNFLTNLSGEQIGVLPYERMDPAVLDDTPEMIHNIPQPDFEAFVADHLQDDPNVEIRKAVGFVSCEQFEDKVVTTVEERGTKTTYKIRSRHVIACDGAKSQVRKSLGIKSEGEDSYETMMTIHFNADLRPVVGKRVGMLHWITDPGCSGFIIAYDLSGNQVLISNFDSEKYPVGSWTEEIARETVKSAIGRNDVPFDILSYRPWILSRKVSEQYHIGNVFLAGDAAHSFPPTGGLGLNSGLADVHNLAYKIAAVHQGWATPKLLETYVDERRPIAMVNSTQSVKNGKTIFSFLKTLGTAGIKDVKEARVNLLRSIQDPDKQQMIADEVEGQREHFDNLEIHIGYVYGQNEPPANASKFSPKFVPGARLLHAWIRLKYSSGLPVVDTSYVKEFSQQEIDARRYSTLDLCPFDKFTLIASSQTQWGERFRDLQKTMAEYGIQICFRSAREDFEFIDQKYAKLFANEARLDDGGGLLVRPDQHILRVLHRDNTSEELGMAILSHLGR